MQWSTIRRVSAALALLLVGGASIAPAQAGPPSKDEGKPLVIAKEGYFFVGGTYHTFEGAQYVSGQAYVEFQIPQNQKHPYPIVMIEGFGLTGTNFTGTPDGREGWAQYFLRQGYAVYVYDQPGRGRAPWVADVYGPAPQPFSGTAAQNAWGIPEQLKLYPTAYLHTQWPGAGVIGDPIFDQFAASTSPAIGSGLVYEALNQKAGAAAAGPHRPGDPARAFPGRADPLAHRRRAPREGQGAGGGRAGRASVLRRAVHRRAQLVQVQHHAQLPLRHNDRPADLLAAHHQPGRAGAGAGGDGAGAESGAVLPPDGAGAHPD